MQENQILWDIWTTVEVNVNSFACPTFYFLGTGINVAEVQHTLF